MIKGKDKPGDVKRSKLEEVVEKGHKIRLEDIREGFNEMKVEAICTWALVTISILDNEENLNMRE